MNSKSVTRVPGLGVSTLAPTWPGQVVTVIADGGGYSRNTALMRDSDNADWIGLGGGRHRHNADTDPAGGRFDDVLRGNLARVVWVDETSPAGRHFAIFGQGAIFDEPSQARIRLASTAVANQYCHASRSGATISYGRRIAFQWIGYVTAGIQMSVKLGVNMEDVNVAHDPDRKFGFEACDSGSVARNYDFVSASGAIRDVVATTEPVQQTTNRGYMFQHRPGLNVRVWFNGAGVISNPNNVSASGSGSGSRNLSMGIKTNNATEKHMYVRLASVIGAGGVTPEGSWFNLPTGDE